MSRLNFDLPPYLFIPGSCILNKVFLAAKTTKFEYLGVFSSSDFFIKRRREREILDREKEVYGRKMIR